MANARLSRYRWLVRGKDDRLRATWRVLIPVALWLIILLIASAVFRRLVAVLNITTSLSFGQFSVFLLYLPLILTLLVLTPRLDKRPLSDYGFDTSSPVIRYVLAGLGIGMLSSGIPAGIGLVLGYGSVSETFVSGASGTVHVLIAAVIVGQLANVFLEEFLYRGVLIQNAAEGVSKWVGSRQASIFGSVVAISLLFGVSHVVFGGGGGVEGRSISLVISSALLGAGWGTIYVLTGNLWLPMGAHFGYNISNGMIFQPSYDTVLFQLPTVLKIGISEPAFWQLPRSFISALAMIVLAIYWMYFERGEVNIDDRVAQRI